MNVNEDLDLRVYGRRRVGILAEIAIVDDIDGCLFLDWTGLDYEVNAKV